VKMHADKALSFQMSLLVYQQQALLNEAGAVATMAKLSGSDRLISPLITLFIVVFVTIMTRLLSYISSIKK